MKKATPISHHCFDLVVDPGNPGGMRPEDSAASQSAPPVSLTVAAAASLTDVLKEVDSLYTQDNPNVTVTPVFAGSGTAAETDRKWRRAIDVFISAAANQMDNLQKEQLLLDGTRKDLLGNKLVLIVPEDSTLGITSFQDLASAKVKNVAIGDPKSVPAGQYAVMVFNGRQHRSPGKTEGGHRAAMWRRS